MSSSVIYPWESKPKKMLRSERREITYIKSMAMKIINNGKEQYRAIFVL